MEGRARDLGGRRLHRVVQAHRVEHSLLEQLVERLTADQCEDLTEDHEVRVGVAPVRPGSELLRAREGVLETLFEREHVERVGVEGRVPAGVGLEVGISRGLVGQHPQRDLVRFGQGRHPLVDGVVERHEALVDEDQEQRGDVGERHCPVAEVHVRGRRDAVHRLAERLLGDDLVAPGDLDDDGLQVVALHRTLDDLGDPLCLFGLRRVRRALRRRRGFRGRCRVIGSSRGRRWRCPTTGCGRRRRLVIAARASGGDQHHGHSQARKRSHPGHHQSSSRRGRSFVPGTYVWRMAFTPVAYML